MQFLSEPEDLEMRLFEASGKSYCPVSRFAGNGQGQIAIFWSDKKNQISLMLEAVLSLRCQEVLWSEKASHLSQSNIGVFRRMHGVYTLNIKVLYSPLIVELRSSITYRC